MDFQPGQRVRLVYEGVVGPDGLDSSQRLLHVRYLGKVPIRVYREVADQPDVPTIHVEGLQP